MSHLGRLLHAYSIPRHRDRGLIGMGLEKRGVGLRVFVQVGVDEGLDLRRERCGRRMSHRRRPSP